MRCLTAVLYQTQICREDMMQEEEMRCLTAVLYQTQICREDMMQEEEMRCLTAVLYQTKICREDMMQEEEMRRNAPRKYLIVIMHSSCQSEARCSSSSCNCGVINIRTKHVSITITSVVQIIQFQSKQLIISRTLNMILISCITVKCLTLPVQQLLKSYFNSLDTLDSFRLTILQAIISHFKVIKLTWFTLN